MKRILLMLILLTVPILGAFSEMDRKTKKFLQKKADAHMLESTSASYLRAYNIFRRLKESYPNDEYYSSMVAITGIYDDESREFASTKLKLLASQAKKDNNIAAWFTFNKYLAEGKMLDLEYQKAIDIYKNLLRNEDIAEEDKVEFTLKKKQAESLMALIEEGKGIKSKLKSISETINTKDDEYNPNINLDATVLVYTYTGEKSTGGLMDESFKPDSNYGEYYEDIFISRKIQDKWSNPKSIGDNINTKGHDASVSILPDGKEILIFKSTLENNGDIYKCILQGSEWSRPRELKGINSEYWEGSAIIQNGGNLIYFSSDRLGGYGGRDLYVAEADENGNFVNVKNMGAVINTPYDEDAPFIHADNRTLFYSSNSPENTFGGYDILMTEKLKNGKWSNPENVGPPVNSLADDKYFSISADARKGYLSSARSTRGYDIYTLRLSDAEMFENRGVVVFKGVVFGDDIPIDAKITIVNEDTGEIFGKYISSASTGLYLFALNLRIKYRLTVEQVGYNPVSVELDLKNAQSIGTIEQNIYLYSDQFDGEKVTEKDLAFEFKRLIKLLLGAPDFEEEEDDSGLVEEESKKEKYKVIFDDNITSVTNKFITPADPVLYITDPSLMDVSFLKGKNLNDSKNYLGLLKIARYFYIRGLIYKVQVAAYEKSNNFTGKKFKRYGKPELVKLSDGVTRFTQGRFKVLNDAEKFRNIIFRSGIFDVWITIEYKGKRYFLEDLINIDFDIKRIGEVKSRN